MTTRRHRKRSKKQSGSARRRNPVIFVDRAFGAHIVPNRLREAGIEIVAYAETDLAPNADDEEWFELCARNGWVAVTKDRAVARRELQTEQIMNAGAMVYFLTTASMTGENQARVLIAASRRILRIARAGTPPPPLMGRISPFGNARVTLTKEQWRRSHGKKKA